MRWPSIRDRGRSRFGSLLDDFFEDIEDGLLGGGFGQFGETDVYEKDGKIHYETSLPEVRKEDIKIKAKNDELVITGEVKQEQQEEGTNYLKRDRRYGRFRRSFPLPKEIEDPSKISAEFKDGILHVQAPLKEPLGEEGVIDVEIK